MQGLWHAHALWQLAVVLRAAASSAAVWGEIEVVQLPVSGSSAVQCAVELREAAVRYTKQLGEPVVVDMQLVRAMAAAGVGLE